MYKAGSHLRTGGMGLDACLPRTKERHRSLWGVIADVRGYEHRTDWRSPANVSDVTTADLITSAGLPVRRSLSTDRCATMRAHERPEPEMASAMRARAANCLFVS